MRVLKLICMGVLVAGIFPIGCISKHDEIEKNETSAPSPIPTVIPAPKQLYIKVGQSEQFTYKEHNITVNYTSARPIHIIKITLDGSETIIQKELSESPRGVYWTEKNLSLTLKPVIWEILDSQKIPVYEKTWNTTELYFEAFGGDK